MALSDEDFQAWLRADGVERVYLVHAMCHSGGTLAGRFMSLQGFVSGPLDYPANTIHPDILASIPDIRSEEGLLTVGEVTISNDNGERDSWLLDAWDGHGLTLLAGGAGWPLADFRPVLTGTMAGISAPTANTLALALRDNRERLAVPVQTATYASGANQGKPIPLCLGQVYNIEPKRLDNTPIDVTGLVGLGGSAPYYHQAALTFTAPHDFQVGDHIAVNGVTAPDARLNGDFVILTLAENPDGSTTLTYDLGFYIDYATGTITLTYAGHLFQVHDGPVHAIDAVRDNGNPRDFVAQLSRGRFQLLTAPVGSIRADVRGALNGTDWIATGADMARYLILRADSTGALSDEASLAAFAATCPQTLGLYVDSDTNIDTLLDQICATLGAQWTPGRNGKLEFWRLDAPTGTASLAFGEDDVDFDAGGITVKTVDKPAYKLKLGYDRNWAPLDVATIDGAVTDADARSRLSTEYRYVSALDESIRVAHPLADDLGTVDTLFVSKPVAEAERDRRMALHGAIRTTYKVVFGAAPLRVERGQEIALDYPRYQFAGGATGIVRALDERLEQGVIEVELWR